MDFSNLVGGNDILLGGDSFPFLDKEQLLIASNGKMDFNSNKNSLFVEPGKKNTVSFYFAVQYEEQIGNEPLLWRISWWFYRDENKRAAEKEKLKNKMTTYAEKINTLEGVYWIPDYASTDYKLTRKEVRLDQPNIKYYGSDDFGELLLLNNELIATDKK
ncbi:hypothetical protein AZF37_00220 [endosymbiont 'TC1' of Trimyema compressum]|nr:hypothetical protein AZF37_00220 [endosymbiont 'TC1' of Trimyema compressum]